MNWDKKRQGFGRPINDLLSFIYFLVPNNNLNRRIIMEETKKCTNKDCLQPLKPICDFYTDKNSKDGKTQWCKDCMKRQRKNYRENNREKALEQGRINSLNYYKKNKEDRKQAFSDYYENNKEERKEYRQEASKQYYENNKEHVKEKHDEYDKNHPTAHLEATKRFYKRNPHVRLAQNAKRRADLIQRTPIWSDLKKIEEIYRDAKRLEKEDGIKRHVDHIIPLRGKIVSGLHVPENLQILTAEENQKKTNKFEN